MGNPLLLKNTIIEALLFSAKNCGAVIQCHTLLTDYFNLRRDA